MWYPILHTDLSTRPLTSGSSAKQILQLSGVSSVLSWLRYILQPGHTNPYNLTIPRSPLCRCAGSDTFTEIIIGQLFPYASLSLLPAFVLVLLRSEEAFDSALLHMWVASMNNRLPVYHSAYRGTSFELRLDLLAILLLLWQSFIHASVPSYSVVFVFY